MIGKFKGVLSGCEIREGKNGTYVIVRFLEDNGKSFESMSKDTGIMQEIMTIPKLTKCEFDIDCIQGTYPRYDLKSVDMVK